jgi:hypothetical protein
MTELDLAGAEELSRAFEPCLRTQASHVFLHLEGVFSIFFGFSLAPQVEDGSSGNMLRFLWEHSQAVHFFAHALLEPRGWKEGV